MKPFATILYCVLVMHCYAQPRDTSFAAKATGKPPALQIKPEILTGGFIDIVQTGQMNASARLFKLYIGEPGRFQIPVSLYTGVSANTLGNSRTNEDFVHHLINPSAGIFNLSFDGNQKLLGRKDRITSLQIQYASSIRLLPAYNMHLQKNITLFNSNESLGLMFITGAWERTKTNNLGVFWIHTRGIMSLSPSDQLTNIFNTPVKGLMVGYSVGMGIEINQTVNVKLLYYRYTTRLKPETFAVPYFQASFNYAVK